MKWRRGQTVSAQCKACIGRGGRPAGGSVSGITVKSDSPTQIDPAQSTFDKVQAGGVNYWVNLAAIISPGSTVTIDHDVTTAPGSADLTFDQTPAAGDSAQVTYEDSTQ